MLGWGACGLAGAAFAPPCVGARVFAAACFVLGFAFSALMDIWYWVSSLSHTWQALTVVMGQGFPYEAAHAIGNVVIALAIGPELRRLLERYARRLRTEVVWAVKLALAATAVALAASPGSYVAAHQQPDGGFAEPGSQSDPTLTAWATLGLAASGQKPSGTAEYLADKPTSGAADLALRILALDALGSDTSAQVAQLEALRRPDGRIGTLVNSTIWGIIALRATDRPAKTSVTYVLHAQHRSGGWAWYPRGAPDSNDTAAAVQALRAGGVGTGRGRSAARSRTSVACRERTVASRS